jgi:hypothetical protein
MPTGKRLISYERLLALTHPPSWPGLTRQSIVLRKKLLAKKMDARVKPAHDETSRIVGEVST